MQLWKMFSFSQIKLKVDHAKQQEHLQIFKNLQKRKVEYIQECELLELFYNILDINLVNRKIIADNKLFLTKLINFGQNNYKPQYLSDGFNEKIVSDYEILFNYPLVSTVFIYIRKINEINLNALKSIELVQLISKVWVIRIQNYKKAPNQNNSQSLNKTNQTKNQNEQIQVSQNIQVEIQLFNKNQNNINLIIIVIGQQKL
ncbi:unnamed protein product [Paramecium sonneborni]|uniref:Uncharacterized protein n=1 Tax=Paramecium sonneborni TaxID=65129 RepID=A0A8S1NSQ6_9CILI|nr:unnamed protein product [Paramecium sonneborni]